MVILGVGIVLIRKKRSAYAHRSGHSRVPRSTTIGVKRRLRSSETAATCPLKRRLRSPEMVDYDGLKYAGIEVSCCPHCRLVQWRTVQWLATLRAGSTAPTAACRGPP